MKYLSLSLAPADLKRIYRAFAKLLHPDSQCGNEEEFKLLQAEYETCQNNAFSDLPLNENTFDVTIYQNVTMPFGAYKNRRICNIPKQYAQWCLDNIKTLDYLVKKTLLWRVQQKT